MPRYNIEHNGKWACFTSVADGFITPFMERSEYEKWREWVYIQPVPLEQANIEDIEFAIRGIATRECRSGEVAKKVAEELVEYGIEENEAKELVEKYEVNRWDEEDEL